LSDKIIVSLIPNDLTDDLELVLKICSEIGVHYVELASMWGKSILDLNADEVRKVHALLNQYKIKVISIQTQIMKVHPPGSALASKGSTDMHRDFEFNISRMDRAIELANEFDAPFIVTYSFFHRTVGITDANWKSLLNVYEMFKSKLEAAQKTAVVECENDTYIGTVQDYLKFFKALNSPYIKANLDLANLIGAQKELSRKEFDELYPYIAYMHVKDRKIHSLLLKSLGVVFGKGNVPWKQVIPWLNEKRWTGVLSVEPHVHGPNRIEMGRECAVNLQKLLKELKIPFE